MAAPASAMPDVCCPAEDSAAAADQMIEPPIAKSDFAFQIVCAVEVDKARRRASPMLCAVRQRLRVFIEACPEAEGRNTSTFAWPLVCAKRRMTYQTRVANNP